jgi:hypothetical protein
MHMAKYSAAIAEFSQKDGTAMKVLALVTITFLPGTFVAVKSPPAPIAGVSLVLLTLQQSLLAIPFFKWDATEAEQVINHRFWVYWTIAIPLTFIVLAAYGLWTYFLRREAKKYDEEDGLGEEEGLVEEGLVKKKRATQDLISWFWPRQSR